MDSTYDHTGAGEHLHVCFGLETESDHEATALCKIAKERTTNPHSGLQLSNMLEGDDREKIRVATHGGLGRLLQDDGAGEAEEVVAAFQGVICKKDLPPVADKISKNKVRFLRQGVSLTAFGEESMDRVFEKIAEIHGLFQRSFGDRLQDCSVFSSFKNYPALDMSNRYFTAREDAHIDDVCDLGQDVDPQGHLARLAGSAFIHTEDNKVHYYERRKRGTNGDYVFDKALPAVFQLGDIVEVQVSFVALPQRDNKAKLSLILRGISLLEKEFTQNSLMKKITAVTRNGPGEAEKATLKRKVGYADEHVSVTRARFNTMDIDDARDDTSRSTNNTSSGTA